MPRKALKTIGKKHGKSPEKMEKYWERAKESAKGKEGVKDKWAYIMATTLKQAQGKGSKPHDKVKSEDVLKIVREVLSECAPEYVKFTGNCDYYAIEGHHNETFGMSPNNRWFGCFATADNPSTYTRIILEGSDATKAQAAASKNDILSERNTEGNLLAYVIVEECLESLNAINETVTTGAIADFTAAGATVPPKPKKKKKEIEEIDEEIEEDTSPNNIADLMD